MQGAALSLQEIYIFQQRTVNKKETFTLLKRASCKGCQKCSWYLEELQEAIDNYILFEEGLEDYDVCSIRMVNVETDRETGYADNYDFQFYKV